MVKRTKYSGKVESFGIANARRVVKAGMARGFGIRLVSVTRRKVTAEMPVREIHLNPSGRVNGGAIMAFADTIGAAGAVANLQPGNRTATLESKTNFFAAGEGPVLSAVSTLLHLGRTTMVWQTTIKNPDRRTVAIVTQTQMVISAKSDVSPAQGQALPDRGKTKLNRGARRRNTTK